MGFNRRIISNELVKRRYVSSGVLSVLKLYYDYADSLRLDIGIASDIYDLVNSHKGDEIGLIYKIQKKIKDDKEL
tara:strand:+ start:19235 stop:19459 length:225 start_codon:yes stop_codon:yes gene_type:complete